MFCDLHADTPTRLFTEHKSLNDSSLGVHSAAVRALGAPLVQLFAIWHDPTRPEDSDKVLDTFLAALGRQSTFHLATDTITVKEYLKSDRSVALLAIEGGNILQGELSRLDTYYQKGVRFLTLVWNGENDLAGAHDATGDVTPFGLDVLKRMRKLGMIADLSHCNERSFWTVAEMGLPLFCSHSNARHICDHTRNLTDTQIRAVIDSGGIIGLNLYPPFVNGKTEGSLQDLLPHIEHICNLGGNENLAIGSDLDGIDHFLCGGNDSRFFLELSRIMEKDGFSEEAIEKILGKNFLNKFCNF